MAVLIGPEARNILVGGGRAGDRAGDEARVRLRVAPGLLTYARAGGPGGRDTIKCNVFSRDDQKSLMLIMFVMVFEQNIDKSYHVSTF